MACSFPLVKNDTNCSLFWLGLMMVQMFEIEI
jgi:hypothetical protein